MIQNVGVRSHIMSLYKIPIILERICVLLEILIPLVSEELSFEVKGAKHWIM